MPSFSPFNIISVVVPEPKIFLCIPVTSTAAAINLNGTKKLLA